MGKILLLIESPGKIATIEKYLGSGYQVLATYGHIYDLPEKKLSIDVDNDFKPTYEIIPNKRDVVEKIKNAAARADQVLLGADADREGFFIAFACAVILKINPKSQCRVTYTEITKTALQNAIKNPVAIDMNMVYAQQARRMLDRLLGYMVSPLVSMAMSGAKSAGRVQSPALRLLVDRQRERDKFFEEGAQSFFKARGIFKCKKQELKTVLYELATAAESDSESDSEDENKEVPADADDEVLEEGLNKGMGKRAIAKISKNSKDTKEIEKFMEKCRKSTWTIDGIYDSVSKRRPAPPFQTSSLQSEASNKLGFSVKRTMQVAQKLYEAGKITYMRSDSIILSKTILVDIKTYVKDNYDKEYYCAREFSNKKAGSQEGHECIRPSDIKLEELEDMGSDEKRLYRLIWARTVASQMAEAEIAVQHVDVSGSKLDDKYIFTARAERVTFPGFLAVYNYKAENADEDEASKLDKNTTLKKGASCDRKEIEARKEFSAPPPMYSEAGLVKILSQYQLTRPATSGPTIEKLLGRQYAIIEDIDGEPVDSTVFTLKNDEVESEIKQVFIGKEKKKLVPTSMGMKVTDFLMKYFTEFMQYEFTAAMEEKLDLIARGEKDWKRVIKKFYEKLEPIVTTVKAKLKEAKLAKGDAPDYERIIGKMEDGRDIYARITKNGPALFIVQPDGKLKYADLGKLKMEKVTEEQARKLFSFPKVLGVRKGIEVILKKGPYGFYLSYDKLTAPVPKEQDPFELTFEEAIVLLKAAKEARGDRYIKEFEDDENTYAVMKGKPGKDDKPSYFVMVKPKPKVESEEDKKSKKKVKKTAEEKEAEKKAKEKKKMAAARGKKSKGDVTFIGIGDRDPKSITVAIVKELIKEKADKPKYVKGKTTKSEDIHTGGKYKKYTGSKNKRSSTTKKKSSKRG
jgi:DNA topoisomerase-1